MLTSIARRLGIAAHVEGGEHGGPGAGAGGRGRQHGGLACQSLPQAAGLRDLRLHEPGIRSRTDLPAELADYPRFQDLDQALAETRPDAVSINTWPNTHADYAIRAMDAGCHVFMEKPIATTYEDALRVVEKAKARNRKLVLGYILRHHPSWAKFVEVGRTLGKPL